MGLDIRAYSNLELTEPHAFDDDRCYEAGHLRVWNEDCYSDRHAGLEAGCCYTSKNEPFRFRAGSYSGYNYWRRMLSEMAQERKVEEVWEDPRGPFAELINFSDCEGVIGPEVAKRLLIDFKAFEVKARKHEHSEFYELYRDWLKAASMAAQGGAIRFL